MKESDMFEPIKDFFEKRNFSVYAEVMLPYQRGRVDLIAYNQKEIIAVEMKTSLSTSLIRQAEKRQKLFGKVFIAIPERKQRIEPLTLHFLAEAGIGILEVYSVGSEQRVKVISSPIFQQPEIKLRKSWKDILKPEHQTWVVGGHSGGGYVTEYALTMKRIHDYLKICRESAKISKEYAKIYSEWRSVREIAEHCDTHFSNAKAQIGPALLDYETEWCEAQKVLGKWFFRHKEGSRKYEK